MRRPGRRWGASIIALIVMTIVTASCGSASVNKASKSYMDGYQVGYENAKISGTYPNGQNACENDLGIIYPRGDDQATYIRGCTDGYNDELAGKRPAIPSVTTTP